VTISFPRTILPHSHGVQNSVCLQNEVPEIWPSSRLVGFEHCKRDVILIQLMRKTILSIIKKFIKQEQEKNSFIVYSHKLPFSVPT
jgi:hypothetical protein